LRFEEISEDCVSKRPRSTSDHQDFVIEHSASLSSGTSAFLPSAAIGSVFFRFDAKTHAVGTAAKNLFQAESIFAANSACFAQS
ncbi:MAG: hypothetical protein ACK5YO_32885, partial [Planctomyces sp.]